MRKLVLVATILVSSQFTIAQQPSDPFFSKRRDPNVRVTPSFTPILIDGGKPNSARIIGKINPFYQTQGPLRKSDVTDKHTKTNQSVFIKAASDILINSNAQTRTDIKAACTAYLNQFANNLKIQDTDEEFHIRETFPDAQGEMHIRMRQQYKGIKVMGGEITLHTRQHKLALLNGQYKVTPVSVNTTPSVAGRQAFHTALQHIKTVTTYRELNAAEKSLLQNDNPQSELIIYYPEKNKEQPRLTWHLTIRPNFMERWEYYVDAHSGEILEYFNHTCAIDGPKIGNAPDLKGTMQQVHTYESNGTFFLIDASRPMFNAAQSNVPEKSVGAIITLDARNASGNKIEAFHNVSDDNTWTNPTAVSAHTSAGIAYEYYRQVFNRNSINGQNGSIISIINVADDDGKGLDNAFWNGQFMAYGNGNVSFNPLAASLDVAGHEMTHGVIENTANLEYKNESGAINESFADIFGVLIEREIDDWQLGEDVVKPEVFQSGAMRDMSDPHNGGSSLNDRGFQPGHLSEKYLGDQDNGGVHINSGIVNHAFYRFATANGVGLEKAEQVYFRALSLYLTSTSQFSDLRVAVLQAAEDLHGADGVEVTAAKAAFDAVGIIDGNPPPPDQEEPAVEGDEFVLAINDQTGSLDLYNTDGAFLKKLTNTTPRRKPSVTDDGSFAIFVSEDNRVIGVSLSGTPTETVLSEDPIWANVAISRDGNKLAATTISEDSSIYIFNLNTEEIARFMLYNPTYSEGIINKNVIYSDAFEWDYSSEYLLYDAFNRIPSENSLDIEYWDVGIIKVWENEQNTFASGEIRKLFNSLPEDVSIGNPSFSKNSPEIVAFDYADFNNEEYQVIGYNIEQNDIAVVFNNLRIGFPGYSRLDDKIIFDAEDNSGNPVVAVIDMAEDKINAEGDGLILVSNAHAGVWFTQGVRPEKPLSTEKQLLSFSFQLLEVPAVGVITGQQVEITVPEGTDVTALIATFTHSALSTVKIADAVQESGVTTNDFNNPVVYTVVAEDGSTQNYTVTVTSGQAPSSEKDILTYSFQQLDPPVIGSITGLAVALTVPAGTDLTALVATFTHSDLSAVAIGNAAQESGTTMNDFTNAVVYTVTAEDGSSQDYTITVTVADPLSNAKELTQFAFLALDPPVVGTITDKNVLVTVPSGTDVTALVATFAHSDLASVLVNNVKQVNGQTPNDFTDPVIYSVVAEDASFQNYLVTVEIDQTTGLDEPFWQRSFSLYPNPSSAEINMSFEPKFNTTPTVTLTDLSGRVVRSYQIQLLGSKVNQAISLAGLATGSYLLQVETGYGPVIKRIIKE